MTRPTDATPDAAWFDAARRHDRITLERLAAAGHDIHTRDGRGRTALHYVVEPFGGSPDVAKWLLELGIDPNVQDHAGHDALRVGWDGVSSGTEANMMSHLADVFRAHGYRG